MSADLNRNSKAIIIGLSDTGERIPACAGRISTQPGTAMDIFEAATDTEKNANLISKVTRSGHNSTVEHTYINLAFQNVSVTVEQFIIEFRLASFTVKSRRYVDFGDSGYYIPRFDSKSAEIRYLNHMEYLFSEYQYMLENGISKEDARFILPYSLFSNFYCSVNAREFLHMLYAMIYGRGSSYPEIYALGMSLLDQARSRIPGIMTDFESRRPSKRELPYFDYTEGEAEYPDTLTELISYTPDAEKCIAKAALIAGTNLSSKKIDEIVSDKRELRSIIEKEVACGRPRALESAVFTFRINGVSLSGITHFARHRMQSIDIPSLTLTDRKRYIMPPSIASNPEIKERYEAAFTKTSALYDELKSEGTIPELLVYCQLSGNALDIVTTMNARELELFLRLRTCNRAQWEIRAYACEMLAKLREVCPDVFRNFGPSCFVDRCPEGTLTCGKAAEVIDKFKMK
ncbi:MAG: FAD-dependent thymidylate synthase [Clostridiales bacterium]|nr:FAD-dependent thymidylate synthase [Clostridiales bacterium]